MLSTEIRWFSGGELPILMKTWFSGLNKAIVPEPTTRTDEYLTPDKTINAGIKYRENALEVKTRIEDISPYRNGHISSWEKWHSLASYEGFDDKENTVKIKKTRWLRYYNQINGSVNELFEPDHSTTVCQVELSALTVRQNDFWSINFEVNDASSEAGNFIKYIIEEHLPSFPEDLNSMHPLSYPEFIQRILPA